MQVYRRILIKNFPLIFTLLFLSSCGSNPEHKKQAQGENTSDKSSLPETGKVYSRATENGSYALYIPTQKPATGKFPALVFLDPHGSGEFPLAKYKQLAENFGYLLVGSNEAKNGMDFERIERIVTSLRKECVSALSADPARISLAGFSGGAKAALANSREGFSGIVYCGAAFPPGSVPVSTPVLGFAGRQDMNYTEVRNFNRSLDNSPLPHTYIEWYGKHEWPDSAVFEDAFYWCSFRAMRLDPAYSDTSRIRSYEKKISDKLSRENHLLGKILLLEEAESMLDGLVSVKNYAEQLATLKKSPAFASAYAKQEKLLAEEDNYKKELALSFTAKELAWWRERIGQLKRDGKNEVNNRLLGYISLAAYSYSTRSVAENNTGLAEKSLRIYELADPENPEHAYLRASLYAKNGLPDSALASLKRAVTLGFGDRSRIEGQPEFSSLRQRNDFMELVSALH
jgi:predicted esterase